ncbi:MAG TPA: hypothetical protein VFJ23_05310 [Candidatus Nitrosotalea sp.]|nr:hypothetical protein [Candidatus Nitrosotalea sp.]
MELQKKKEMKTLLLLVVVLGVLTFSSASSISEPDSSVAENKSVAVTHTTTVKSMSPPEWPPCCQPVILSQVELASQFRFLPDNITCTSQPAVYPQHSCLTNLVPDHKVECSYISGNSCEPLHQYTSGTNKSCFVDSTVPLSSGTQWFDLYNTQNKTVQLQYFGYKLISGDHVQGSEGGGFDIGPHEKCTLALSNNYSQGALEVKPVNMTLQVSYYSDGKPYTTATPSLTDTYNDFGTWQFDGNKWVFAEQNTMTVPEFPFAVPVMLIGIISTIVFYRMKFRK